MVLEAPACLGAAPRPQILSGHPLISIAGAYNVAVPRCWLRRLILLSTATLTLYAQAEVEDYIRSEMELNGIPGLSLAVIDDGELAWAKAYGVQSVASGQPLAVDSPMELASVSKSLTALAVLRLEREGLLQRDQSIATYLPDLLVGDPRWRDVTARHLLQHRSGLRRADDFRVPCCGQPGEFDLQVAVSRIARARLESRPGEIFSYSNANYILAAALVERLGGRPFPDFMEKQVFAELGMTNTTVDRPRAKAWGLADPHEWQWGRVRVSPSVFFGVVRGFPGQVECAGHESLPGPPALPAADRRAFSSAGLVGGVREGLRFGMVRANRGALVERRVRVGAQRRHLGR